jgi:hypothetical protein
MVWFSLIEIGLGIALIAWKKPDRQISIRWFVAGILLITFGGLRLLIW